MERSSDLNVHDFNVFSLQQWASTDIFINYQILLIKSILAIHEEKTKKTLDTLEQQT